MSLWLPTEYRKSAAAFIVAFLVFALDYFFHAYATDPMEVPAYFIVKFLLAFIVAYTAIPVLGLIKASLLYTVLFSILYYGVGLYVLGIPGLSVWSSSSTFTFLLLGFPVPLWVFGTLEFFVHFTVFFLAGIFGVILGLRKPGRRPW